MFGELTTHNVHSAENLLTKDRIRRERWEFPFGDDYLNGHVIVFTNQLNDKKPVLTIVVSADCRNALWEMGWSSDGSQNYEGNHLSWFHGLDPVFADGVTMRTGLDTTDATKNRRDMIYNFASGFAPKAILL